MAATTAASMTAFIPMAVSSVTVWVFACLLLSVTVSSFQAALFLLVTC